MRRVLFVAEAATLAHVARPAALAASVDPRRAEVWFACAARGHRFLTLPADRLLTVDSVPATEFADRLRRGVPVYRAGELRAYVEADLGLIRRVQPDVVVGDFRLSLSVSARISGVPYATISNAYWSPYATERSLPLPVLPWTRFVPLQLAQAVFDLVRPLALVPHVRPLNRVRAEHNLPPLPSDLRHAYTDADYVLYADAPSLFPLRSAPPTHRHLGPILWSPPVPLPPWWAMLPTDRPLAYVTMGSSGDPRVLATAVAGLAQADVGAIVSTAGAAAPESASTTAWFADYLPGESAATRSALVVCNGGSPTAQQALSAGVPVLGICGNMDQMLNMRALEAAGIGLALRADRLTAAAVAAAVRVLLGRSPLPPAAQVHTTPRAPERFNAWLDEVMHD